VGNYWSDYTGYDADGDGVGDFAHEPATLFESLTDRHPKLRLFLFSPSQQAVEFVARAVPAVRPEPKFFDDGPRVTPVAGPAGGPREAPSRAWLALAGGALLLGGLALLLPARAGGHA
jgi:nitrous oxidase accessory protein